MKRVIEFTLGLIGSIFAALLAFFTFFIAGFIPVTNPLSIAFATNFLGLIFSIIALVFSCLINKKTKLSSIMLIILSILIFLTNFLQVIPMILLLLSGILGLVRKI